MHLSAIYDVEEVFADAICGHWESMTDCWPNGVLMVGQRRWPNIKTTLDQRLVQNVMLFFKQNAFVRN